MFIQVSGMSRRLLTPFDEWPDKKYLELLEAEHEHTDLSCPSPQEDKPFPGSAKKNKPRRRRTHTKSTGMLSGPCVFLHTIMDSSHRQLVLVQQFVQPKIFL